jgi:hypothetical protein
MPNHPLAEVFGFPTDNLTREADRCRRSRLCPYNNKVPNCTKDKADNPLGVCSVFENDAVVITCPIRFRQDWLIAEDAAAFFFPEGTAWTSLTEVRLNDKNGRSAGNIDIVQVSYDERGRLTSFGALEVQAVYISGNIRRPFEHYMEGAGSRQDMDWTGQRNYPRPDYLSSSRKRLAPQLIYKGGILHAWNRRMAVALNQGFFGTLPPMAEVEPDRADIAWLVYDLVLDGQSNRRMLTHARTVYTEFETSLDQITKSEPGEQQGFVDLLQEKLDQKLDNGGAPDAPTLEESL